MAVGQASAQAPIDAPTIVGDRPSMGWLEVSWAPVAGAAFYEVRLNSGDIESVGSELKKFWLGLASSTKQHAQVRAVDPAGNTSDWTSHYVYTLTTGFYDDADAPTGILWGEHSITNDSITFSWKGAVDNSSVVTDYRVSIDDEHTWVEHPTSEYTFDNLSPGTYTVEVRAIDAARNYSTRQARVIRLLDQTQSTEEAAMAVEIAEAIERWANNDGNGTYEFPAGTSNRGRGWFNLERNGYPSMADFLIQNADLDPKFANIRWDRFLVYSCTKDNETYAQVYASITRLTSPATNLATCSTYPPTRGNHHITTTKTINQLNDEQAPTPSITRWTSTATDVTLHWSHPDHDLVDRFQIRAEHDHEYFQVDAERTSWTYTSQPERTVNLAIRAVAADGSTSDWAEVDATTKALPLQPPTFEEPTIASTRVVVRWSAPSNGPRPSGYLLQVDGREFQFEADEFEADISGLPVGTSTRFTLNSLNADRRTVASGSVLKNFVTTNALTAPSVRRNEIVDGTAEIDIATQYYHPTFSFQFFRQDGTFVGEVDRDPSETTTFAFSVAQFDQGISIPMRVVPIDVFGTTGPSTNFSIAVPDTVPPSRPTLDRYSALPDPGVTDLTIYLEDSSDNVQVKRYVAEVVGTDLSATGNTASLQLDLPNRESSYTLNIFAEDLAGNRSAPLEVVVRSVDAVERQEMRTPTQEIVVALEAWANARGTYRAGGTDGEGWFTGGPNGTSIASTLIDAGLLDASFNDVEPWDYIVRVCGSGNTERAAVFSPTSGSAPDASVQAWQACGGSTEPIDKYSHGYYRTTRTLATVTNAVRPTTPGFVGYTIASQWMDFAFTPSTDDQEVTGYVLRLEGTDIAATAGPDETEIHLTDVPPIRAEPYVFTLTATDPAGNESDPARGEFRYLDAAEQDKAIAAVDEVIDALELWAKANETFRVGTKGGEGFFNSSDDAASIAESLIEAGFLDEDYRNMPEWDLMVYVCGQGDDQRAAVFAGTMLRAHYKTAEQWEQCGGSTEAIDLYSHRFFETTQTVGEVTFVPPPPPPTPTPAPSQPIDTQAPDAPRFLGHQVTKNSVTFQWDVAEDNVTTTFYEIWASAQGGTQMWFKGRQAANQRTYTLDGYHPGTNLRIEVIAMDQRGNKSVAAVLETTTAPDDVPPDPPRWRMTPTITSDSVTIFWARTNSKTERFRVYYDGDLVDQRDLTQELSYTFGNLGAANHNVAVSAVDRFGNESQKITKTVQVEAPAPTVDTEPPSQPVVHAAEIAEDRVTISWDESTDDIGVQLYEVWFSINGGRLWFDRSIRHGEERKATLEFLKPGNEVRFEIIAADQKGHRSDPGVLSVATLPDQVPPGPPLWWQEPIVTTDSVTAYWRLGDGQTVAFNVYVNGRFEETRSDRGGQSITVRGLAEGATTTVAITALDQFGNESSQLSSTFTTLVNDPPSQPGAADDPVDTTLTTATVRWAAATDDRGVAHYIVELIGRDPIVVDNSQFEYTFEGLTARTGYQVRITAVDIDGKRGAVLKLYPQTSPAVDTTPPDQPTISELVATSPYSIELTWGRPDQDVERFLILVDGREIPIDLATYQGTSLSAGGLTPATTYSVSLIALDEAGNRSSATTDSVRTHTVDSPPSAPADLRARATYQKTINIEWDAATDAEGIAEYVVNVDGKETHRVDGNSTRNVILSNLDPGTWYRVSVYAVDNAGQRGRDVIEDFRTDPVPAPNVPVSDTEPPSMVTSYWLSPEGSSVTINWQPVTDNVGVAYYRIGLELGESQNVYSGTTATFHNQPNGTHYFTLAAVDASGNIAEPMRGMYTVEVTAASVATEPGAQNPPVVSTGDGERPSQVPHWWSINRPTEIDVYWDAASDNVAVTSYQVSLTGPNYQETRNITNGQFVPFSGLQPATTYTGSIAAMDGSGNVGPALAGLVATTSVAAQPTAPSGPQPPTNIVAQPIDADTVVVTFDVPPNTQPGDAFEVVVAGAAPEIVVWTIGSGTTLTAEVDTAAGSGGTVAVNAVTSGGGGIVAASFAPAITLISQLPTLLLQVAAGVDCSAIDRLSLSDKKFWNAIELIVDQTSVLNGVVTFDSGLEWGFFEMHFEPILGQYIRGAKLDSTWDQMDQYINRDDKPVVIRALEPWSTHVIGLYLVERRDDHTPIAYCDLITGSTRGVAEPDTKNCRTAELPWTNSVIRGDEMICVTLKNNETADAEIQLFYSKPESGLSFTDYLSRIVDAAKCGAGGGPFFGPLCGAILGGRRQIEGNQTNDFYERLRRSRVADINLCINYLTFEHQLSDYHGVWNERNWDDWSVVRRSRWNPWADYGATAASYRSRPNFADLGTDDLTQYETVIWYLGVYSPLCQSTFEWWERDAQYWRDDGSAVPDLRKWLVKNVCPTTPDLEARLFVGSDIFRCSDY